MEEVTMDNDPLTGGVCEEDDRLRQSIADLLKSGLETEVEPRAYDSEAVQQIVTALQEIPRSDFRGKLTKAGFTMTPYRSAEGLEEACKTCMYYLSQRRFCQLPELMIPVEPEWSCRLWRI
jgi:hypothetical protein